MSEVVSVKRRKLESDLLSKLFEIKEDPQKVLDTYGIIESLFSYYKTEFNKYVTFVKEYRTTPTVEAVLTAVMREEDDAESDFVYSHQFEVSIKFLVDSLRESCKREILNKTLNTFAVGEDAESSLEELYNLANQQLKGVGAKNYETLYDRSVYDRVCDEAQTLSKGEFLTGLPELDAAFTAAGLTRKELVVFKSRSGNCKTWTLVRLVVENLKRGTKCYVLSPELPADEFLDRVLRSIYGGQEDFSFNNYKERFYNEYLGGRQLLEIEEGGELGRFKLGEIKRKALTIGAEMIVIDGLRYTIDPYSKVMTHDQYGIVCFNLLAFSKKYGIPIICCVQENRTEGGAKVANISGSDQIAHNATAIIGIKKDTVGGSNNIAFVTEKMRRGEESLTIQCEWEYRSNQFTFSKCERGFGKQVHLYDLNVERLNTATSNYRAGLGISTIDF